MRSALLQPSLRKPEKRELGNPSYIQQYLQPPFRHSSFRSTQDDLDDVACLLPRAAPSHHLTLPHFDFVFTFKVRTDGRRMPRLAFRPCAEQEPGPSTRDKPQFHSVPRGRASVPPAVCPIEPHSSASRNNSGDQTQMTLSISRQ